MNSRSALRRAEQKNVFMALKMGQESGNPADGRKRFQLRSVFPDGFIPVFPIF